MGRATVVTLGARTAGGLTAVQAEWGVDGGAVVLTGKSPFADLTGRAGFRSDGSFDGTVRMRARVGVLGISPRRGVLDRRRLVAGELARGSARRAPGDDAHRGPAAASGRRVLGRARRKHRRGQGRADRRRPSGLDCPRGTAAESPYGRGLPRAARLGSPAVADASGCIGRRRTGLRHRPSPVPRPRDLRRGCAGTAPGARRCHSGGPHWTGRTGHRKATAGRSAGPADARSSPRRHRPGARERARRRGHRRAGTGHRGNRAGR